MHWHGLLVLVHGSNPYGIVELDGLLLLIPTFANAKSMMHLLAYGVWALRCTTLLCLAILSHIMS